MSNHETLDRARAEFEAGKHSKALRHLWSVVLDAQRARDVETLRLAEELSREMTVMATGKDSESADQIARYATASADAIENGVLQPTWWQRLLGMRETPSKKCPDCAETIQQEAKVCRYCGFRFDTPS